MLNQRTFRQQFLSQLPLVSALLHSFPEIHLQSPNLFYRSSKWESSEGLVIMGGDGASNTTEILRNDLTSDPYFDITETR